jgi:hypothetical protein
MNMQNLFKRARTASTGLILGLALGGVAQQAGAGVIFEQLPYHQGGSWPSSFAHPTTAADDFALGAPSVVNRITWWGIAYTDEPFDEGDDQATFAIQFYEDDEFSPGRPGLNAVYDSGSLLASRLPSTIQEYPGGAFVYEYSVDFVAPYLTGSGLRYLSIVSDNPQFVWYWQTNDDQGGASSWYRDDPSGDWSFSDPVQGIGNDLAFRLEGDIAQVSEPGTLPLLAFAAGGLVLARVRRKK